MAKMEHPERYGWWINELESLGLCVKKTNEFNDLKEIRSLAEILKEGIYLDYKIIFYQRNLQ
ncbi:MAG TPA: hypothetical protein VEH06_05300 [Candidatus Bathyarchaeia archaeon]|nr:hypothetical protein [Candidatus Bathyarchaeia archaeon]